MAKIVILGINDGRVVRQLRKMGHEVREFQTEKSLQKALYDLMETDIFFTVVALQDTKILDVCGHISRIRCFGTDGAKPYASTPIIILSRFGIAPPISLEWGRHTVAVRVPNEEKNIGAEIIRRVQSQFPEKPQNLRRNRASKAFPQNTR